MQTSDYRRENMRNYIANNGGPTTVAERLGYSNGSYIVQMTGPNPSRPISERNARMFEERLGLPEGSLDAKVPLSSDQMIDTIARTKPRAKSQASLTPEQMGDIVLAVGAVCETEGVTLPIRKLADLISLVVMDAGNHNGDINQEHVKTLVRLTK